MMSSKRILALLLAVVLCVCVFCGCAQKEPAKEQQGVTEEKKEEKTEVVKTSKPVSYTHLDVYKRQGYNNSSAPRSA